jgi:hypothetical protein
MVVVVMVMTVMMVMMMKVKKIKKKMKMICRRRDGRGRDVVSSAASDPPGVSC